MVTLTVSVESSTLTGAFPIKVLSLLYVIIVSMSLHMFDHVYKYISLVFTLLLPCRMYA